jgi:WD40 repeat protein
MNPLARTVVKLSGDRLQDRVINSPSLDRNAVSSGAGYWLYDSITGAKVINSHFSDSIYEPVFSPDGTYVYGQIIERSKDVTTASLRDTVTGEVIAEIAPVQAAAANNRNIQVDQALFSEHGTWLATRHWSAVILHDGATGREISRVLPDPSRGPAVNMVYFGGPNEDRLITAHEDGSVRLWDISRQSNQGRQLINAVCHQKLLRPLQNFSAAEMQDPILAGQSTMQAPCTRVGPLAWSWWLAKMGLLPKETMR